MALNGENSNEEPVAGAVAIQITVPMVTCLRTIAYRITVKTIECLTKQPPTLWPHVEPTNPQSHCCDLLMEIESLTNIHDCCVHANKNAGEYTSRS